MNKKNKGFEWGKTNLIWNHRCEKGRAFGEHSKMLFVPFWKRVFGSPFFDLEPSVLLEAERKIPVKENNPKKEQHHRLCCFLGTPSPETNKTLGHQLGGLIAWCLCADDLWFRRKGGSQNLAG